MVELTKGVHPARLFEDTSIPSTLEDIRNGHVHSVTTLRLLGIKCASSWTIRSSAAPFC